MADCQAPAATSADPNMTILQQCGRRMLVAAPQFTVEDSVGIIDGRWRQAIENRATICLRCGCPLERGARSCSNCGKPFGFRRPARWSPTGALFARSDSYVGRSRGSAERFGHGNKPEKCGIALTPRRPATWAFWVGLVMSVGSLVFAICPLLLAMALALDPQSEDPAGFVGGGLLISGCVVVVLLVPGIILVFVGRPRRG